MTTGVPADDLRELANATTLPVRAEAGAANVTRPQLREAAERCSRRHLADELAVARERERLEVRWEPGREWVRQSVVVKMKLNERAKAGEVGREAAGKGGRGEITEKKLAPEDMGREEGDVQGLQRAGGGAR